MDATSKPSRPRADDAQAPSRRDLLRLGATAAPAAAAAVALGGAPTAASAAQEAPSSLGLRKTEHVKKYLDSARF